MQSLLYVKSSDGTANASLMTVQTLRSPGASTILVNTVSGVPAGGFYASMGAPHTFTDPITSEVITVISDATAVDFAGHINAGQVIIDAIAPGYVDTRGSLVGDIIIIRPVTEWANNIFNVLNQSLADNGAIKAGAITADSQFAAPVSPVARGLDTILDHVVPGGGVLAGLGYGSTLTASLSAGVCYINGNRQLIAAVATRTYTASKDTYVDALYDPSGTVVIVYTEVANNAASPVLAANSVRLGIVVSGVNIAAAASINQGQEDRVLPISSSIPYCFTDSLGNIICPRDGSTSRQIGYRQIITNIANTTLADVTGLNLNFKVPAGRKVEATGFVGQGSSSVTNNGMGMGLVDVTAGATLVFAKNATNASGDVVSVNPSRIYTPSATTINIKAQGDRGSNAATWNTNSSATNPSYIRVKLA